MRRVDRAARCRFAKPRPRVAARGGSTPPLSANTICPGGGTGIRACLRNRIMRVRISLGAPNAGVKGTGIPARPKPECLSVRIRPPAPRRAHDATGRRGELKPRMLPVRIRLSAPTRKASEWTRKRSRKPSPVKRFRVRFSGLPPNAPDAEAARGGGLQTRS